MAMLTEIVRIDPTKQGDVRVQLRTVSNQLRERVLPMTVQSFEVAMTLYGNGGLIQQAFPGLSASEREFLLTGMSDDEWNELSDPEDDS